MKRKHSETESANLLPVWITLHGANGCDRWHRAGRLTKEELELLRPLHRSGPSDRQAAVASNEPAAKVLRKIYHYSPKGDGVYENPVWVDKREDSACTFRDAEELEAMDEAYYHVVWEGLE